MKKKKGIKLTRELGPRVVTRVGANAGFVTLVLLADVYAEQYVFNCAPCFCFGSAPGPLQKLFIKEVASVARHLGEVQVRKAIIAIVSSL